MRKFLFILLVLIHAVVIHAQDSAAVRWTVESEKAGEGVYKLYFRSAISPGWQLYAPDAVFADIPSGVLLLQDSAITVISPLKANGQGQSINSSCFFGEIRYGERDHGKYTGCKQCNQAA